MRFQPLACTHILLLLPLVACGPASTPRAQATPPEPSCMRLSFTSFTLTGAVNEEEGRHALPGTVVRVLGSSRVAVTDSAGAYRISDLPLGTYLVEASRADYYREQREVAVYDGDILRPCAADTTSFLRFHMRRQSLP
jgi:hypothetical protein